MGAIKVLTDAFAGYEIFASSPTCVKSSLACDCCAIWANYCIGGYVRDVEKFVFLQILCLHR